MRADRVFIKQRDVERKVIEITPFFAGRRAARAPKLSGERHQIDQRCSGSKLRQADIVLHLLHRAAEPIDIEGEAALKIRDTQYDVIDGIDPERDQFFTHFTTFI